MEKADRMRNAVLLLDHYDVKADMLRYSMRSAGFRGPVAVLADDGFLPDDVIGLYHWFLREAQPGAEKVPKGNARFFDQIDAPDFWQISGNNHSGEIFDKDIRRGEILYSDRDPGQPRLVREVRWNDRTGKIRFADLYDRFGELYGRRAYDSAGHVSVSSWLDASGREIITENAFTGDIILNWDEKIYFFRNRTEFALFFLREYERKTGTKITDIYYNSLSWPFFVSLGWKGERVNGDLLFWQEEPRQDVPGNMQAIFKGQTKTRQICVQNRRSFANLVKAGAPADALTALGYVYHYRRKNSHGRQVLICTNSDQIQSLQDLVSRFPQLHFHIAALTEMSQKLLDFGKYANVSLYPNVRIRTAEDLFGKCDYYLDINYGGEILDAVRTAYLHDQLILGFEATAHNRAFTAKEHIFSSFADLAKCLSSSLEGKTLDQALAAQKKEAMDEPASSYERILRKETDNR